VSRALAAFPRAQLSKLLSRRGPRLFVTRSSVINIGFASRNQLGVSFVSRVARCAIKAARLTPERTSRKSDGDALAPKPIMVAELTLVAFAVEHQAAHDGKWAQTMMRSCVVTKRPITDVAATSIDSVCASGRHSIQRRQTHKAFFVPHGRSPFWRLFYASDLSIHCRTNANRNGYCRRLGSTGLITGNGYQAGCYNSQRCASFCNQHGGTNCKQVCQRRASTMPHC